MKRSKWLHIIGTRPNIIKWSALHHVIDHEKIESIVVHTGQHYSNSLGSDLIHPMGLPKPDIELSTFSHNPIEQYGRMMTALCPVLDEQKPDLVFIYGDVNSSAAGARVAQMKGYPIAHVEAGLRSHDMTMPEEVNRKLIDELSTWKFVSESSGMKHLEQEGLLDQRTHLVGNVMIDTLEHYRDEWEKIESRADEYVLFTLHRPSNVDSKEAIELWLSLLEKMDASTKVVFPLHPRTEQKLIQFNLFKRLEELMNKNNWELIPPLNYFSFVGMISNATAVVTDSGGVQEESSYLGVPCFTLRPNPERPITISEGPIV